jgi:hypothetical protein
MIKVMPKAVLLDHLTVAAWRAIADESGLPDGARGDIEEAIYIYRAWQRAVGLKPPAETKAQLSALGKDAAKARSAFEAALQNPRAHVALATAARSSGPQLNELEERNSLPRIVEQLQRLEKLVELARSKVVSGGRGNWERKKVLVLVVGQLDEIWRKFKNTRFTRTKKGKHTPRDFVTLVCRAMDPEITPSSIDEAMKVLTKNPGRISKRRPG